MNQREIKTTQEACFEVSEALRNLLDEIFKSLKVKILVDKLNKLLKIIWKTEK